MPEIFGKAVLFCCHAFERGVRWQVQPEHKNLFVMYEEQPIEIKFDYVLTMARKCTIMSLITDKSNLKHSIRKF